MGTYIHIYILFYTYTMFDSGLWADRIKKEKALRKNEKTSNLV